MRKPLVLILTAAVVVACGRREAEQNTATAQQQPPPQAAQRVAVPAGPPEDPAARERERFDTRWRNLLTFRDQQRSGAQQRRSQPAQNIRFVRNAKESLKNMTPQAINAAPISVPITGDVSGPTVLKTQVYLDRLNYSPGVIDGRWGKNTAISLWWYQRSQGLNATGDLNEETFRALAGDTGAVPAVATHNVTAEDLEGPFVNVPDEMYDKAKLDCLCYESVQEKLAERFHTTPDLLAMLNPNVNFSSLQAGATINVPNVRAAETENRRDVSRVVVSLNGNTLNGYDGSGNLVFHAPTTVGSQYDPSPTETLKITAIAHDPHFHYQPKLFHEVPDEEPEATLQPGPNSPVGVVWMQLSKPHYGIHGTSDPESIGYASSHGCIRLTNWDAHDLAHRVSEGVQVEFVDTRREAAEAE